jgi:transposase
LIAPQGIWRIPELHALAQNTDNSVLPEPARACAELIMMQIEDLQAKIKATERTLMARHRTNEMSLRLATIPGIGVITATAMVATVVDASAFKSGRHFAAWIGLVPQQNGTGGKVHLGRISKKGEPYLRRLLVLGATAVVRYARNKPEFAGWVNALLARRPARVVTVAVANKLARIVWAITRAQILRPGERRPFRRWYRPGGGRRLPPDQGRSCRRTPGDGTARASVARSFPAHRYDSAHP